MTYEEQYKRGVWVFGVGGLGLYRGSGGGGGVGFWGVGGGLTTGPVGVGFFWGGGGPGE